MDPFSFLEHSAALFINVSSIFLQLKSLKTAGNWRRCLSVAVTVSLIIPYALFFVDWRRAPKRASTWLLSWTRLNGQVFEILAFEKLASSLKKTYNPLFYLAVAIAFVTSGLQVGAIGVSASHVSQNLSLIARKSIIHVGGLVFHTFVTLGWTLGWIYTLGKIWKNDKSSGSAQSSGWDQSHLGRLIEYFRGGARQKKEHPESWTIAYCTIVYLIVTGGGLACLFIEDELWAFLCENLSECLVFPVLTRLILSESSEQKDTEKEDPQVETRPSTPSSPTYMSTKCPENQTVS